MWRVSVVCILSALLAPMLTTGQAPPTSFSDVSGVMISGRVVTPPGVSAATMKVAMSGAAHDTSTVAADGSFEFKDVPPGRAILRLETLPDVKSNIELSPLLITVAGADIGGLEFVIPPHVTVECRVVVEGTTESPPMGVSFASYQGGPSQGLVITDDASTVDLVEGEYNLSWFRLPQGYRLKALTSGLTDLLAKPLKITPGVPPYPVVVTLMPSSLNPSADPRVLVPITIAVEQSTLRPEGGLQFASFQGDTVRSMPRTEDGESMMALLQEGDYRVSWETLPSGYSLKSLTSGAIDLLVHPLRIRSGAQPAPVVVTLIPSAPWPRIRGWISGMPHSPASGATTVVLSPRATNASSPRTQVGADGWFDFPRVPPGLYTIRIDPDWPVSPDVISVMDHDSTIEVAAKRGHEIRGRVQFASPSAKEIPLTFGLTGDDDNLSISVTMGLDGTFKATFPEGKYSVSMTPPEGFRLGEMTFGPVNALTERITIGVSDQEELRLRIVAPATRVNGEDPLLSRCIMCSPPPFPPLANAARITGTVTLSIVVANDGTVADVKIISGHQLLRQAALDAARAWIFQPPNAKGGPPESSGTMSAVFAFE